MYIVIVGAGRVGFHLCRALLNGGHEVVVIEKDTKRCESASRQLGNIWIKGDASEFSVLTEAGTVRADVIVAATGSDEDNLAICQLARGKFKVARTIALVNDPQNDSLFSLLGVDVTVSSTQLILGNIEEELPERPEIRVLPIRGNREVVGVEVPSRATVVGLHLGELSLPTDILISAIISRDGSLQIANENTLIQEFDQIVAIATVDSTEALINILTTEK
jgi:trk system potassium uptake protein TrkA